MSTLQPLGEKMSAASQPHQHGAKKRFVQSLGHMVALPQSLSAFEKEIFFKTQPSSPICVYIPELCFVWVEALVRAAHLGLETHGRGSERDEASPGHLSSFCLY